MPAPFHLRSLQALEMAVRHGSFVGAAADLGITPAAVGQRVKALETYLGVELLVRGRSGIRPTPELRAALPALTRSFAALEEAMGALEAQRGHDIHIAAPSDVVELWLLPRLAPFRASHPNIRFCINGEGDAPLRLGRVDVELGFGPADDPGVDVLFHDLVVPLASPLNVERIAAAPAETRLEGFPILHLDLYRNDPAGLSWPDWLAANGITRSAPDRGMRFQRAVAALDAVAANAGLTLCGLALAAPALATGRVALAWPISTARKSAHALTARYRIETGPHLARFRAWLRAQGAATTTWLAQQGAG
jgi:LysR family glycine cleavage system transcriptional activator